MILMQNVTATKEFTWDCAHVLANHEGLCRNLHGHTYKMEVTARYLDGTANDLIPEGPSKGMVVDFKDLKNIVNSNLVNKLDHSTIIDVTSGDIFEHCLHQILTQHDKKVYLTNYRPTAENMANDFINILNRVTAVERIPLKIVKIRLYETPTSYAEVER